MGKEEERKGRGGDRGEEEDRRNGRGARQEEEDMKNGCGQRSVTRFPSHFLRIRSVASGEMPDTSSLANL